MPAPMPKVAVAVMCERVLQENDGVMSLIRIIDKATVNRPKIDKRNPVLDTNVFLSFRADGFVGKKRLSMRGFNPDGKPWKAPPVEAEIEWTGPDHITNVTVRLRLTIQSEGLYCIQVTLNDKPVSRIPLTVVWTKPEIQTAPRRAQSTSRVAKNR